MLMIYNITVLRHKATSSLSQSENLNLKRYGHMYGIFTGRDTTAESSGEREWRTAASLKPNSCV